MDVTLVRTRRRSPLSRPAPDEDIYDPMADRYYVWGIRPVLVRYNTKGHAMGADAFDAASGQMVRDNSFIAKIAEGDEVRELTQPEFDRAVDTLRRQIEARRRPAGPNA